MGSSTSQKIEANDVSRAMSQRLTTPRDPDRSSPADRLCDGFAFFFGSWTLVANGAVFVGASLRQLEAAYVAVAVTCSVGAIAWLRRRALPLLPRIVAFRQ